MVKEIRKYLNYIVGSDQIPVPTEIIMDSVNWDLPGPVIVVNVDHYLGSIFSSRYHAYISLIDFKKWRCSKR